MFTDLHRAILTAKNSYMNLEHGIWCPSMCSETWLVWILSSIRNENVVSNIKVCSCYNGNKIYCRQRDGTPISLNFNKKSFACEVLSSQSRICQYKPSARKYGDLEEALEKPPL